MKVELSITESSLITVIEPVGEGGVGTTAQSQAYRSLPRQAATSFKILDVCAQKSNYQNLNAF